MVIVRNSLMRSPNVNVTLNILSLFGQSNCIMPRHKSKSNMKIYLKFFKNSVDYYIRIIYHSLTRKRQIPIELGLSEFSSIKRIILK